jgi:hypothetical protein
LNASPAKTDCIIPSPPGNQSSSRWHQTAAHKTMLALLVEKLQQVRRFSGNAWDLHSVFCQSPSVPGFSRPSCSFKHASNILRQPHDKRQNTTHTFFCDRKLLLRRIQPALNRSRVDPSHSLPSDHGLLESGILIILASLSISFKSIWDKSHKDDDTKVHLF